MTPNYQSGFANEFATEALPGALPVGRNSPQRAPYGLYAEQLSGTAFTAPRHSNRRSWLYRIRPAAMHLPFERIGNGRLQENTFRPPWFHRNFASEFMGLIHGAYDAKAEGFAPGGASLHNCMSGHGPDADTFAKASAADTTRPDHVTNTMAFMFETPAVIRPTRYALESSQLQSEYYRCWQGLKKHFNPAQL
jgi:homogentisate 1,2-dioxygenase